jgi:proteic killer suppression protein
VLRSFRDKDTEAVWRRRRSRRFDLVFQRVAWRKLAMLDGDAGGRADPAGDRAGQHSIRVSQQWRVCFRWTDAGPEDVEIADYH